ncbi:2-amino-3-carboxymuconate-6-semialdehyde decarboxylase [Varanus komodoensis]|nr:2-amino-3-carboxymuconate-6-semialdehyde decarboxylase [Varanus komodoensis]
MLPLMFPGERTGAAIEDKVMLGTDYPFPLGEHEPGKLIESIKEYDDELKDKLKFDNALAFLNLDRHQFE